ncbi:MAG: hypothetical protein PUF39_04735, partial [Prevotellaceae bacterium]|nr:hypothetical protein [Prevotellaceae bacterium]
AHREGWRQLRHQSPDYRRLESGAVMEYFSCSESVDSSVTIRKKDCTVRHGNLRLAFRRGSTVISVS